MDLSIKVRKVVHNNENRIIISFPYEEELVLLIKKFEDARWSKTHRAWHIPQNKYNISDIFKVFKNKAWVDYRGFSRKDVLETTVESGKRGAKTVLEEKIIRFSLL